jgi:hypothetical protein
LIFVTKASLEPFVLVQHPAVERNVRVPLGRVVAQVVVHVPRLWLQANDHRRRVAADQLQPQHGLGVRPGQTEGGALVGQGQSVAGAVRQIAHGHVGLAGVGLEGQRKPAETVQGTWQPAGFERLRPRDEREGRRIAAVVPGREEV